MISTGINHLALSTKDMKAQIAFFSEICGMDLVGLFWFHGGNGAFHCFLKLNDSSYMSFVQTPDMEDKEPVAGVSHPSHVIAGAAPGGLQHVAFNVGTQSEVIAMRDRIRKAGYQVVGPIDHGISQSIYLSAPENLIVEFTSTEGGRPLTPDMWVNLECARLCGISPEELQRYMHPAKLQLTNGSEAMPKDPKLPFTAFPPPLYAEVMKMTDAEVSAKMKYTVAPNEEQRA